MAAEALLNCRSDYRIYRPPGPRDVLRRRRSVEQLQDGLFGRVPATRPTETIVRGAASTGPSIIS